MPQVTIAAGSQIAADAGADIAHQGGNAVDAAIAATLVSMCTDIGVMAPGARGFVSIWPPNGSPVVIDAYAEVPGRGLSPDQLRKPVDKATFDDGGMMSTGIGYRAIATPGIFAGLGQASTHYGTIPWHAVVQPAIRWVRDGFVLSGGAAEYLTYTHSAIFSWHPDSYQIVHNADGHCLSAGAVVAIPALAASLDAIAQDGAEAFYTGTIGQYIARTVQSHEGRLTADDLREYQAVERSPIAIEMQDWKIITNPAPAVGGACLAAILLMLNGRPLSEWNASAVMQIAEIQQAVLGYRNDHLHEGTPHDIDADVQQLLKKAQIGDIPGLLDAPSTVHISAIDSDGLACSITASAGYGSGVFVPEIGMWLNNSLGELELHPGGIEELIPGTRLASNMAPTIARKADGTMLAIGSPGASRITTAIAQVLFNIVHLGLELEAAIAHPRLHFEWVDGVPAIAYEAGLPINSLGKTHLDGFLLRPFVRQSMYFGGVQAALLCPDGHSKAVADPRRGGGTAQGGRA